MATTIRIKAKRRDGIVDVKTLMKHPMAVDSGDTEGHYITEVKAMVGDRVVFSGLLGPAVSKDPYLNFSFADTDAAEVTISWVDNKGEGDENTATIK